MRLNTKINTYLFCLFIAPMAFAGGPDIEQTTTIDNAVTATGGQVFDTTEQTIGGNKSDAFAIGLGSNGAAAIDDCLYTVQGGFGAAQWAVTNKMCLADQLDQMGKHKIAAQVRCTINPIQKLYRNRAKCEADMLVTPKVSEVVKEVPRGTSDIEPILKQQEATVTALQARITTLEQEAEKARTRAQRPVSRPQTIIKQESFLTPDKRAALAALRQ